jgi:hypothetical protein
MQEMWIEGTGSEVSPGRKKCEILPKKKKKKA